MNWIPNLVKKLYGNAVVLRNLKGQAHVPYLPAEELHALRDARLRRTVAYAAKTVPYYEKFFRENKIDPQEIRTMQDLETFPLLDKDTVRKMPEQFVSTSRSGKNAIHFLTSGTTGKPLDVYHDLNSLLANIAFGERERAVLKSFQSNSAEYKELYIAYSRSTIRKVWDVYKEWTFSPLKPKRLILSSLDPLDHVIDEINRFRPDAIRSSGSYLELLFKTIHLRKIQVHLPRIITYIADSMTKEGRTFIEETFGIPILSIYNCVEVFKLGFICEKRTGFHLHEDLSHVRIINSDGENAKNGEKGEVVISNLLNRGSVLLNYRLGDVASLSDSQCSCGRTLRLLSDLEGRIEDIIFLPNGKFIHPRTVWNIFKGKEGILQYQLIQHEPQRFELKLVTVDRKTYNGMVGIVLNDLRDLLGGSPVIECEFYEELPRERGGKFRPVISLCKPPEYQ